MNLFEYVGQRIRDLRQAYGGRGLSQEELAHKFGVAANTISRWETSTYRPSLEDLDKLARFFSVSILEFFPREEEMRNDKIAPLLRAIKQLPESDLEELRRYAEFRQARHLYSNARNKKREKKEL